MNHKLVTAHSKALRVWIRQCTNLHVKYFESFQLNLKALFNIRKFIQISVTELQEQKDNKKVN